MVDKDDYTYLRFYRTADMNVTGMNMKIIEWLNACKASHYWRDYYVLVGFDRSSDAAAFRLTFDLEWMPDREARIK